MSFLSVISDEDCRTVLQSLCSIYRSYIEIQEIELHALERMCEDVKDNYV